MKKNILKEIFMVALDLFFNASVFYFYIIVGVVALTIMTAFDLKGGFFVMIGCLAVAFKSARQNWNFVKYFIYIWNNIK